MDLAAPLTWEDMQNVELTPQETAIRVQLNEAMERVEEHLRWKQAMRRYEEQRRQHPPFTDRLRARLDRVRERIAMRICPWLEREDPYWRDY